MHGHRHLGGDCGLHSRWRSSSCLLPMADTHLDGGCRRHVLRNSSCRRSVSGDQLLGHSRLLGRLVRLGRCRWRSRIPRRLQRCRRHNHRLDSRGRNCKCGHRRDRRGRRGRHGGRGDGRRLVFRLCLRCLRRRNLWRLRRCERLDDRHYSCGGRGNRSRYRYRPSCCHRRRHNARRLQRCGRLNRGMNSCSRNCSSCSSSRRRGIRGDRSGLSNGSRLH